LLLSGYQREKARGPTPTPVPAAPHQIGPLSEAKTPSDAEARGAGRRTVALPLTCRCCRRPAERQRERLITNGVL